MQNPQPRTYDFPLPQQAYECKIRNHENVSFAFPSRRANSQSRCQKSLSRGIGSLPKTAQRALSRFPGAEIGSGALPPALSRFPGAGNRLNLTNYKR